MKHAGPTALDALEDLLAVLRQNAQLVERARGTFYRKGAAFLHFHEDPAGLFADLKIAGDFERFRVSSARERSVLLRKLAAELAALS